MENKQSKLTKVELTAIICGILSALLGLTIITGWTFHLTSVIQIKPVFAAMVFNTALSFLLSGIGIVAHGLKIRILSQICGAFVSLLGLLTIIQYAFGIDLGIDKLVFDPYVTVKNPFPGRMAPNTSLAFLFAGIGIFLLSQTKRFRIQQISISLIGASAGSLGVMVLIGYAVEFEAIYGWGDFSRMAPSTATGFVLCGLSLFCFSIAREKRRANTLPRWLPMPIGMGIATAALILWQAVSSTEIRNVRRNLGAEVANIGYSLSESLNNQMNGFIRMAKRWEAKGGTPRTEWIEDAGLYVSHRKGCRAIYWVDPQYNVKWIVPTSSEKEFAGQRSLDIDFFKSKLESGLKNNDAFITPLVNLPHGGNGFLVSVPVFIGGMFSGMIQSEYEAKSYLSSIMQNHQKVFINLRIGAENGEELNYSDENIVDNSAAMATMETNLAGATIRITAWPKEAMLKEGQTLLPIASLFAGLITAVLVSFLISFYQTAQARTYELSELNQSLERKVEARTREIKERDEFTRQWLSGCTDGAWDWNLEKNTVRMTSQFKSLLGYDDDEIDESVDNWRKLIPPVDLQVADKAYNDYINLGQRYAYQLRWIHKNGSMVWTMCRGEGIKDDSGKIVRMVGTLTDISQLKILEEKLIHWAEELERKNADLERFNRLAVGREKRMIELKARINALSRELGKGEPYNLDFAKDSGLGTGKVTV